MAKTNPNKANQHTPDERQAICWEFYVQSILNGKPNAYESAIKAGYEESSASLITVTSWFIERNTKLKRRDMLSKAEQKLEKTLDYSPEEIDEEGNMKIKTDLLRIQTDVAKHITSTLGKEEGYSSRIEQTGANGKDLIPETFTEEEKTNLLALLK
jgi:hypothetical protein